MWDTMYNAEGVGLAAPQIGRQIRLFVIDASPFFEEKEVTDYELKCEPCAPAGIFPDGASRHLS